MRDRWDVLGCDHPGCGAQVAGPALRLADQARDQGWQVYAVTRAWSTDDGPDLHREDRCPDHTTAVVPDEVLLAELGGPGGVTRADLTADDRAWR